jgi:transposase
VLGVDDWAKRKGHTYGTILVDLEQHRPIDLLPDRTADTLATWLRQHPGIDIISRDRATAYSEGATLGAPQAVQVADRFHLLANLVDALSQMFIRQRPHRHAAQRKRRSKKAYLTGWQTQRQSLYDRMHALHAQGLPIATISNRLGLSQRTIYRWQARGVAPTHARSSRLLAPYLPYLHHQWAQGYDNGTQLWREITQQGYTGSLSLVLQYIGKLRKGLIAGDALPPPPSTPAPEAHGTGSAPHRQISARAAAFLLLRPAADLTAAEQETLQVVLQTWTDARTAYPLGQAFAALMRERTPGTLDAWMATAAAAAIPELRSFTAGLERDRAAVMAAMSLPWNNGQVEGQVNRLKLIKRQMYGRANFDLLRQRVLLAA